jgi:osmotically inducible protein OsmC
MKRKASAVWQGGLKDGNGTISTESGVLSNTSYSFAKRFEDEKGTNPEELIAAAHASCFAMATSAQLGGAGITAQSISANAIVTLEKLEGGFAVTASHLEVTIKAPGADRAKIQTAAENAKAGCPISKLLNAKISLETRIEV